LPFQGANTLAVLASLASETPPAPRSLCEAMPQAASDFIMKLIEKDPERRPASAREAADTLNRLFRDFKKLKPATDPSLPLWNPRWGKWWWWAAGGVASLLVALTVAFWDSSPNDAKNDAAKEPLKAAQKSTPVDTPSPADDSLLGRLKRDAIPAEDLTWAFGTGANVPRDIVGLIRNSAASASDDVQLATFALSSDDRWLAYGGAGLQAVTYDLATGKSHLGSRGTGAVGFFFSLSKNNLFTGVASGSIVSQNLLNRQEKGHYSSQPGVIATAFAGSLDTTSIVMGAADGKIHYINPNTWKLQDTVSRHSSSVVALLYRPEVKKLVSGDANGTIISWSAPTGKALDMNKYLPKVADRLSDSLFPKDHGKLRQIAFGPDVNTLLVAFANSQSIHRITLDRKTALAPFATSGDIAAFALAPDRKTLATITPRGHLRLWSYSQERRLVEYTLPSLGTDSYGPLQFAPDGKHILIGHPRGAVVVVRAF